MLVLLFAAFASVVYLLLRVLLIMLPKATDSLGPDNRLAWGLTLAITALGINALSEPFTLLYWYSGAVNYMLPLIFTVAFAAAALRVLAMPRATWSRYGWAGAATASLACAVGSGEIAFLSCLGILAALGTWMYTTPHRGGNYRIWLLWLGVTVVVGGILLAAPGNWQRLEMADPDVAGRYHRWVLLLPRTLLTAARMAARPPVLGAILVLAVGVALTVSGPVLPRPAGQKILLVLASYAAFNCLGVAFLKAAFMRDLWVEAMPARVVNVLVLQLLMSTVVVALWVRHWLPSSRGLNWLRQRPLIMVAAVAGVLFSGQARWAWPELLLMAPAYETQMGARYKLLAAAYRQGSPEAVVPPLHLKYAAGLLAPIPSAQQRADVNLELHIDCRQKNNELLANYYSIPCVRLTEPPVTRQQ
ncbi:hypothetical protein BEN48_00350 [Hymenobacter glacialis]|uniref:Uncharacterized protein n=2 Tax=Hymenobacter glacialis TaxID=1908236 RepID=A0A1G1T7K4_9BACT|nr:hypothetical protein BEN48_00350 [Hymenobacter glacialis]